MYNTSDYVKEDLCFQRLLRRKYLQQLRGLPCRGLSTSIIKNQTYYYKVFGRKENIYRESRLQRSSSTAEAQIHRELCEAY